MSHIRDIESFVNDYPELLDAWEKGGVDGLIIGPMTFGAAQIRHPGSGRTESRVGRSASSEPRAAFDPDPAIYAHFGVEARHTPAGDDLQLRASLTKALEAVKDRGWSLWLFDPFAGGNAPHIDDITTRICDERAKAALAARMVDTIEAFPMADGVIIDSPAWGFEITKIEMHGLKRPRLIFDELPPSIEPASRSLGYDYHAMVSAKDQLWQRLHKLDPAEVRTHADGGVMGASTLLGGSDLFQWFAFRVDALTAFYEYMRRAVDETASRPVKLAIGPRTPAVAQLAGYEYRRVAGIADVVMPKLYYWHRGFDGLPGTIHRYATTLTTWNPTLTVQDACLVARMLFGASVPVVDDFADFDRLVTPEYLGELVHTEGQRAVAAVGDQADIVPWVTSGRAPHYGDPITAAHLEAILIAAESVGIERVSYHQSRHLGDADWTVLSRHCGTAWDPRTSTWQPSDQSVV